MKLYDDKMGEAFWRLRRVSKRQNLTDLKSKLHKNK